MADPVGTSVRNPRNGWLSLLMVVLLFGGLAVVFGRVLANRLSRGEIYPHYSSLRSDPLGTRALYESLEQMPALQVGRNLRSLNRIEGLDANSTLLLLGIPRDALAWLDVEGNSGLLPAVRDGARLVIAVNPGLVPRTGQATETLWWQRHERIRKAQERRAPGTSGASEGEVDSESQQSSPGNAVTKRPRNADEFQLPNLLGTLGVQVVVPEMFERPEGGWEISATAGSELPVALPDWFSQCRLSELSREWRVLAKVNEDGQPVIAERAFGKGTVVLISGVYFASNEALWSGPSSEFLLWMLGDRQRVIFDESIHGAKSSSGVAQWITENRLHGYLGGLLLVVVLFAWRSGASLIPKRGDSGNGGHGDRAVTGEAADSGLVKLLRRSVARKTLLKRCLALWKESGTPGLGRGSAGGGALEEIESVVVSSDDPVTSYTAIVEILRRRRF